MIVPPWVAAAALGGAFAVGSALGAYGVKLWANAEIATIERDHAEEQAHAVTLARQEERDARIAAAAVLDQPRTVRVLCRTEPINAVPGAGGAVDGNPLPARGDEQDIAARVREVLAVDTHNRALIHVPPGQEKPR